LYRGDKAHGLHHAGLKFRKKIRILKGLTRLLLRAKLFSENPIADSWFVRYNNV
jgi:hypothetical protein